MIGLKVAVLERQGVFECISEPYVSEKSDNTYIMVKDLHTNKIHEINAGKIDKEVTDQEYKRWNNG